MTQYGHFNELGQYVIENPFTPEPWLHYLIRPGQPGTETFCSGGAGGRSTQDYYLNGKQQLHGLLSCLGDETARTRMLEQVSAWWQELLGLLMIHSPEKKLDNAFRWQGTTFFISNV